MNTQKARETSLMDKVYCLLTPIVLNSKVFVSIKEAIDELCPGIEVLGINAREGYASNFQKAKNLITWGVKSKSAYYKRGGKNVLFLENGLFAQQHGIYIDHEGYFVDSSIVTEKEYLQEPSIVELDFIRETALRYFKWELEETKFDPNGPIMVAMQMNGDAPLRHHFPAALGMNDRKKKFLELLRAYVPDVDLIVRPHPKEKKIPEIGYWPNNWKKDYDGNIYKKGLGCRGIITVNSTVATEFLAIGMPVATFGHGSYTNSGATLDCSENQSKVSNIVSYTPDMQKVYGYLAAVSRHQLSYNASKEDVLSNRSFNVWCDRIKNIGKVIFPSSKSTPDKSLIKYSESDIEVNDDEIVAIFVGVNAKEKLPKLKGHYTRQGIDHLIYIDNKSNDGSARCASDLGFLVYEAKEEYDAENNLHGALWQKKIADKYADSKWCLMLDIDEFIVFQDGTIKEVINSQKQNVNVIGTNKIDVYADSPLHNVKLDECEYDDMFALCPYFDKPIEKFTGSHSKWRFNGVRIRKFDIKCGGSGYKENIIRWKAKYAITSSGWHNLDIDTVSESNGVTLHFSYTSSLPKYARKHFSKLAPHWKNIAAHVDDDMNMYDPEHSVRYVEDGKINYDAFLKSQIFTKEKTEEKQSNKVTCVNCGSLVKGGGCATCSCPNCEQKGY